MNSRSSHDIAEVAERDTVVKLWDLQNRAIDREIKLMEQLRHLQADNAEMTAGFVAQIRTLTKEKTDQESQIDSAATVILDENRRLKEINAEIDRRYEECLSRIAEFEATQAALEEASRVEIVELKRRHQTEKNGIRTQIDALIKHLHILDDRHASSLANKDATISELKAALELKEVSLNGYAARTPLLENKCRVFEAVNNRLQRQIDNNRATISHLEYKIERLESDLKERRVLDASVADRGVVGSVDTSMIVEAESSSIGRLEQIELIRNSGLFDEAWYLSRYQDRIPAGQSALEHYVAEGQKLDFIPSPLFDPEKYLARHPDVGGSGIGPLLHYLQYGYEEAREFWPVDAQLDTSSE